MTFFESQPSDPWTQVLINDCQSLEIQDPKVGTHYQGWILIDPEQHGFREWAYVGRPQSMMSGVHTYIHTYLLIHSNSANSHSHMIYKN